MPACNRNKIFYFPNRLVSWKRSSLRRIVNKYRGWWCERVKVRKFGVRFSVICYRACVGDCDTRAPKSSNTLESNSLEYVVYVHGGKKHYSRMIYLQKMRSAIDCVPSTTPSRNACLSVLIYWNYFEKKIPRPYKNPKHVPINRGEWLNIRIENLKPWLASTSDLFFSYKNTDKQPFKNK